MLRPSILRWVQAIIATCKPSVMIFGKHINKRLKHRRYECRLQKKEKRTIYNKLEHLHFIPMFPYFTPLLPSILCRIS